MYQFTVYPLFIPANFVRLLKTHHRFEFWNVKLLIKNGIYFQTLIKMVAQKAENMLQKIII